MHLSLWAATLVAVVVFAGGCASEDVPPSHPTQLTSGGEVSEPAADVDEVPDVPAPAPVVVSDVVATPNEWMTLAASVSVTTDRQASVVVRARAEDHAVETPATPIGTSHELVVLGMRPEREYEFEIIATRRSGKPGPLRPPSSRSGSTSSRSLRPRPTRERDSGMKCS